MNFVDDKKGFGLVETLVGVSVFVIVTISIYSGYTKILQGIQILKIKNAAASLANEQIEIVRNLPYSDVGIVDGLPPGKLLRSQIIKRNGIDFDVLVSVRDIDDPFDGLIGETPNDLSPADYKLVQYNIKCTNCPYQEDILFYSRVSPQNLENYGNNGALFIQVFDSSGQPVSGAEVHVENNQGTSTISIDEVTNNKGVFQIVNAPIGVEAYEITTTKDNYSVDKTYTTGSIENPAPNVPHANVVSGEVTQMSFAIDKLSDLFIKTKTTTCDNVPFIDMNLHGSKTIGVDVYKYDENLVTNSLGKIDLYDIEWDNYIFKIIDGGYDLAGASELLPIDLVPDTSKNLDLIVSPKDPNSLLVQVKDAETSLPLSGAQVTLSKSGINKSLVTNRGFVKQTDWSGGGNQEMIGDDSRYYTSDGNLDMINPAGDVKLLNFSDIYVSSGSLTSSTFDMGTTTNFHILNWGPSNQPAEVGSEGVKFQIATNLIITATSTWNYVGPNGTSNTYYTSSGQNISEVHDGDRYLRYKMYLQTANSDYTPIVSEVFVTFASECAPPGQVFFTNLDSGEYSLTVDLAGYQQFYTESFMIDDEWQMSEIILNSNT